MVKDEINTKPNVLCHFLNNIGFLMEGKIIDTTVYSFCDAAVAKYNVM